MSGIGWLIIAALAIGVLTIQFIPELLHSSGKLLDRLPPKLGLVILAVVISVCLLAGMVVMHG